MLYEERKKQKRAKLFVFLKRRILKVKYIRNYEGISHNYIRRKGRNRVRQKHADSALS